MGRRKSFPAPEDRTINEPMILIPPDRILALYNQEICPAIVKLRVDSVVRQWFIDEAHKSQWAEVSFHGHQCLLRANIAAGHEEKPSPQLYQRVG